MTGLRQTERRSQSRIDSKYVTLAARLVGLLDQPLDHVDPDIFVANLAKAEPRRMRGGSECALLEMHGIVRGLVDHRFAVKRGEQRRAPEHRAGLHQRVMENVERPEYQAGAARMAAHVIVQRAHRLIDVAPRQYAAGIDDLGKQGPDRSRRLRIIGERIDLHQPLQMLGLHRLDPGLDPVDHLLAVVGGHVLDRSLEPDFRLQQGLAPGENR